MNLEIEKLRIEDVLTQDSSDEFQGREKEANLKSHRRRSAKYICIGGILMFLAFTSLFLYMDPSKKSDIIDFNKHPFLVLTSHTDPDFKWNVFVDIPSHQVFLVKESSLPRIGAGSGGRRRLLSASDTNFDESKVTQVILHKFNQDHITLYRLVEGNGIHTQCSRIPVASGFELISQLESSTVDDDWDGMPLLHLMKINGAEAESEDDDEYDGMPPPRINGVEYRPHALFEPEHEKPKIDHEKIKRSSEQKRNKKDYTNIYSDFGPDVPSVGSRRYQEQIGKENEKKSYLLSELGNGEKMNQRPDSSPRAEHEKAKSKTKLSISIKVAEPFDINRIKTKLSEAGECPLLTPVDTEDSKTKLHSSEFWDRITHHQKMDIEDTQKKLEKEENKKKKENLHDDEKDVKKKKDSGKEHSEINKEYAKESSKGTIKYDPKDKKNSTNEDVKKKKEDAKADKKAIKDDVKEKKDSVKEGIKKEKEDTKADKKDTKDDVKTKKDTAKEDIKDKKGNVRVDAKDSKQEDEDAKKEGIQRLVVLGATGDVGLPIVKNAIGRKIRVLAVSLDAEAKLELEDKNLEVATLNLTKEGAISEVLNSNDTVIFCALCGQKEEYEKMIKTTYEIFEKKGIKRVVHTGGNAQMKNEEGKRYFETEEIQKTMPSLWIDTAKAQEKVLKSSKLDWTEVDFGTVLPGSKTPESGTAKTFLGEESRLIEFEELLQDVEVLTIPVMGSYVMADVLAEKIVDIALKKVYLKQHIAIHSGVFAPKSTEK